MSREPAQRPPIRAIAPDPGPAEPAWGNPLQAAKVLMVLGLLKRGPRHGYELHRVVVAHGSVYADLKKPTLYHLLERLARQGFVALRTEEGARGPRGERLVYSLTAAGEAEFLRLLRELVVRYAPLPMAIEMAVSFLTYVPLADAIALLNERRTDVLAYRQTLAGQLAEVRGRGSFPALSGDHLLAVAEAELGWIDRALKQLRTAPPASDERGHT
jgi:DNA-binding PadR family transcriptional regulator